MARPNPQLTAQRLVETRYPESEAVFLAGSVIRGEGTPTSDLDIVIITSRPEAPFRESLVFEGWPVEAFVHSQASVRRYFASDAAERRPMLPMMCAEGIIVRSQNGLGETIKSESQALIDAGPPPLTPEERDNYRYALTDLLDDFEGSEKAEELFYIAPKLAALAVEFFLAFGGHWIAEGKWIPRVLRTQSPILADRLMAALEAVYHGNDKIALSTFADAVLAPAGGRLFAGYYRAGKRPE